MGSEDEVVEVARADEDGEEKEVDEGEESEIASRLARLAAAVFAEGDEAGEGGNGGAQPAYVDRDEKVAVVRGEAGEKHGGGHVADDLTGRRAHEQRRERNEVSEGALHRGDA